MDYSPWSSKNSIDQNQLKKVMQIGVDVKCMHAIPIDKYALLRKVQLHLLVGGASYYLITYQGLPITEMLSFSDQPSSVPVSEL